MTPPVQHIMSKPSFLFTPPKCLVFYDIYSRDLSKKVRQARERLAVQGKYTAGAPA